MRTLRRRHAKGRPGGDFRSACAECRAPELRSELVRRADGLLYHRKGDCQPSKVAIELSEGNAEKARQARRLHGPADGAGFSDRTEPFEALGQPTNPMVGWAWIKAGGAGQPRILASSSDLTITKLAAGDIAVSVGADFSSSHICQMEPFGNIFVVSIPLMFVVGKAGAGQAIVKVRNRILTTGSIDDRNFFVLFYGAGRTNMLTTVGMCWVKGSDGTIIDSGNNDPALGDVTPSRTGTGTYQYLLSGATARFCTITQQCQGDPGSVTPGLLQTGIISGSQANGRILTNAGNPLDADHVVRFWT